MKVAIVGAGLCGLSVTWHLSSRGDRVDVFDFKGIGGGASGVAAGILHPYAGLAARKSWLADEGMAATHRLIQVAEENSREPVRVGEGLLRLAMSARQQKSFSKCAQHHDDVTWKEEDACDQMHPSLPPCPGIWISSGLALNVPNYLHALWEACQKKGAHLHKEKISHPRELKAHYDHVVLAAGAGCAHLPLEHSFPFSQVKGQLIEIQWPSPLPPLSHPVNSFGYVVPSPTTQSCWAGATFEHDFNHPLPDPTVAEPFIREKIQHMLPCLQKEPTLNVTAGIRLGLPNRRPLIEEIYPGVWLATALGSKGLLYHGLMGEEIAKRLHPQPHQPLFFS